MDHDPAASETMASWMGIGSRMEKRAACPACAPGGGERLCELKRTGECLTDDRIRNPLPAGAHMRTAPIEPPSEK
jgi:hypothetical protein